MTVAAIAVAAVGVGAAAYSASAQSGAVGKAGAAQYMQYQQARQDLQTGEKTARSDVQPWVDTGKQANNQLAYEMGLNPSDLNFTGAGQVGALTTPYGMSQYQNDPGYTPMVNSLQDLQNTPGYQFQLQQGLQSVNNSAAAKGSLLSGANIKAINDYAQGQASTGYQAAWDRAQQAYQNAFNRNTTNQNNAFQRMQSISNNGQSAATQQGNYTQKTAANLAGLSSDYGNNAASLALAQGQVQADMYQGISNAVTSGVAKYGSNSKSNGGGGWFGG